MREKILSIYAVAIILGVITGLVCSLFQLSIKGLNGIIATMFHFAGAHGWPVELLSAVLTAIMVFVSWLLVQWIAPEAAGSGVPEIEGVLLHQRPIFWRRLLPVKFIGGVLSISAKMVLGREGPAIQIGGNLGEMLAEICHFSLKRRDALIAAGAAAGLAAAFNAPLAGVLFVLEEMRNQFNFSFINFKTVALACVMSTIVLRGVVGNYPAIQMPVYDTPQLYSLGVFFLFGVLVGFAGLIFNVTLIKSLDLIDELSMFSRHLFVIVISLLVGYLAYVYPNFIGGGYDIIDQSIKVIPSFGILSFLLIGRFIMTMLCYGTGVPGGIFAPMLALGTLLGMAVFYLFPHELFDPTTQQGMFAVAGMGGLFSAAVRAPLTGIVLVVEMTQNYSLILPLMVTCLTATTVVQLVGNPPIYTQLLNRKLRA